MERKKISYKATRIKKSQEVKTEMSETGHLRKCETEFLFESTVTEKDLLVDRHVFDGHSGGMNMRSESIGLPENGLQNTSNSNGNCDSDTTDVNTTHVKRCSREGDTKCIRIRPTRLTCGIFTKPLINQTDNPEHIPDINNNAGSPTSVLTESTSSSKLFCQNSSPTKISKIKYLCHDFDDNLSDAKNGERIDNYGADVSSNVSIDVAATVDAKSTDVMERSDTTDISTTHVKRYNREGDTKCSRIRIPILGCNIFNKPLINQTDNLEHIRKINNARNPPNILTESASLSKSFCQNSIPSTKILEIENLCRDFDDNKSDAKNEERIDNYGADVNSNVSIDIAATVNAKRTGVIAEGQTSKKPSKFNVGFKILAPGRWINSKDLPYDFGNERSVAKLKQFYDRGINTGNLGYTKTADIKNKLFSVPTNKNEERDRYYWERSVSCLINYFENFTNASTKQNKLKVTGPKTRAENAASVKTERHNSIVPKFLPSLDYEVNWNFRPRKRRCSSFRDDSSINIKTHPDRTLSSAKSTTCVFCSTKNSDTQPAANNSGGAKELARKFKKGMFKNWPQIPKTLYGRTPFAVKQATPSKHFFPDIPNARLIPELSFDSSKTKSDKLPERYFHSNPNAFRANPVGVKIVTESSKSAKVCKMEGNNQCKEKKKTFPEKFFNVSLRSVVASIFIAAIPALFWGIVEAYH